MDALGLAALLALAVFLLLPMGALALRMVQRVIFARTLGALLPVEDELPALGAYIALQTAAIGLGFVASEFIAWVGVPALVLYFAVRLLSLPNFVEMPRDRCFACKYPMVGLDADHCPECGSPFRPGERGAL